MTRKQVTICDACNKEITGPPLPIIVDDGVYRHLHYGCAERNLSTYMTGEANIAARARLASILLTGKLPSP